MNFFKAQPPVFPNPIDSVDLSGKTIIITGSNQGLGYETARQLLIFKAGIMILAVRNPSRGEEARQKLLADPAIKKENPRAEIRVMNVDMADYKSVIKFAEDVKRELPVLHVLLLNAGCGQLKFEIAPTGHEKVMQVNYLSNVLLTLKLLPLLEATAAQSGEPSRLSWVGSRAHYVSSFYQTRPLQNEERILERMDDKSKYSGFTVYSDTKMLVAIFISELGKSLSSEKVIVNNMCPGQVNTHMMLNSRPPEQGGWIITYGTVIAGKESHGRFLKDKDVAE
jgi:NAD(P)-dependent dehydrogenase (short-subunit alcohol dehydrogenase family)